jgi:hypothetical protein
MNSPPPYSSNQHEKITVQQYPYGSGQGHTVGSISVASNIPVPTNILSTPTGSNIPTSTGLYPIPDQQYYSHMQMSYQPQIQMQYNPFPGVMIPITNLADLATRPDSCMVSCPNCNMTGMTTVEVKPKMVLLVIAIICFVTCYPALIGFILLLFTFYRAHVCSRCKFELSRVQICC